MSADRQILRGFSVAFGFLLIAKGVGAVKEMVLAQAFGTSAAVDAYALGIALSQAPITLAAMAGNMILIPYFVARRHGGAVGTGLAGGLWIGAVALSLILAMGVYGLLFYGGGWLGLDPTTAASLRAQALGLALSVPSGIGAALLSARLMAAKRQINSLFEAIPSLCLIVALFTLEGWLAANTLLAGATALGMVVYLAALFLADGRSEAAAVEAASAGQAGNELSRRERVREFALILAAQTVFVLGGMALDQLAAAHLPQSQNAVLSYANRLLMLATSLGATAVGRAILPVLAEARLRGQGEDLLLTRRWAARLFTVGLLAFGAGFGLAPFIIRVLFERGAFTAEDTSAVTAALRLGLMSLPAYFAALILAQAVVVQRRFGLFLFSNCLAVVAKLLILILFLDRFGLPSILLGGLVMQMTALIVLCRVLRRGTEGCRHEA